MDPGLQSLAEAFGVATEYEDWRRRPVSVPEDTVRRVLTGLGVAFRSTWDVASELKLGALKRVLPAFGLRRAHMIAVAGEVPSLIFQLAAEHPAVGHDADIAARRQHPRRQRAVDGIQRAGVVAQAVRRWAR